MAKYHSVLYLHHSMREFRLHNLSSKKNTMYVLIAGLIIQKKTSLLSFAEYDKKGSST